MNLKRALIFFSDIENSMWAIIEKRAKKCCKLFRGGGSADLIETIETIYFQGTFKV